MKTEKYLYFATEIFGTLDQSSFSRMVETKTRLKLSEVWRKAEEVETVYANKSFENLDD